MRAACRAAVQVASFAAACRGAPAADPGVLYGGCAVVTEAGIGEGACVAPGGVTLWLPATLRDAEVTLDGAPVSAPRADVDHGHRLEIAGAGVLAVPAAGLRITITDALADDPRCGLVDPEPGWPAWRRGVCWRQSARAALDDGHGDDALARYRRAGEAFTEAGWTREARLAAVRGAFISIEAHDVPDRGAILGAPDHGDAVAAFLTAMIEQEREAHLGDHRGARASLRFAADVARRALSPTQVAEADERLGLLEVRVGRFADGLSRYLEALALPSDDACWRADRQEAFAWALLQLHEAGLDPATLPLPDPVRAAGTDVAAHHAAVDVVVAAHGCGGRGREADRHVNRALAALHRGDLAAARVHLTAAESAERNEDTTRWLHLARARLLGAEGDGAAARASWRLLEDEANAVGDLELGWRAIDGLATLALADGRRDDAAALLDDAWRRFVAHAGLVPLRGGRGPFLELRADRAVDHVQVLLDLGRDAAAFETARGWRAQLLASPWQGERTTTLRAEDDAAWTSFVRSYDTVRRRRADLVVRRRTAPLDETAVIDAALTAIDEEEGALLDTGIAVLGRVAVTATRAIADGEVMLLWLARVDPTGVRWVGLGRRGDRVVVAPPIAEADARQDPSRLLAPFADLVPGAARVTLLTPGALDGLDLHTAAVAGRPLLDHAEVVWSVDRGAPPRSDDAAGGVLVLADPTGGLAAARAEGQAVAELWRARGQTVHTLGRGTRLQELTAPLAAADVLHFAGHGELPDDPWDARLLLADATALTLRDIITLPRVPRLVVLAGCETARTEARMLAAPGLAQAFVHAGAEAVVASARPVDDDLARRFSLAFYAADPATNGVSGAWREAVRAVAAASPTEDWASFRLIVR